MKLRKNLLPAEGETDGVRSEGVRRLLDVINRDGGKLVVSGWLACIGLVPYVLGLLFAVRNAMAWAVIPCGILGGAVAAPQIAALTDRILRGLRDDYQAWWSSYRRVWKRDFFASLLPGALTGLILGAQIYAAVQIGMGVQASAPAMLLVCLEVNGILIWMWAQIPVLTEGIGVVMKNAAMLSILHFGRTLCASAWCLVYSGAVWLFWPFSEIPFLFTQLWLPGLVACFMIYKPYNEIFGIEERLAEQAQSEQK